MTNTVEIYLNDLWEKLITFLRNSNQPGLDNIVIDTYYSNSRLVSLDNNKAIVVVDNEISKQVIITEINLISQTLSEILNDTITCEILNKNEFRNVSASNVVENNTLESLHQIKFNQDLSFEKFVVGGSNKESHAASLACAYNPGKFYTPLFIYGNSGLGKTHLLNAIGNFIKTNYPEKVIYYTSGSDFVESVVTNIQKNTIDQFKRNLYNIDVLLMDDIQFIAGKEKSHEIFFSVFNELVNDRKQICITSDKHPTEIKGLEERLISRFSSGLSVGLDSPEFETAVAILKLKISHQIDDSISIDENVLSYIAQNFSKDVRSLEGCINRLLFMTINTSEQEHIDLPLAMKIFKAQVKNTSSNEITPSKIKKEVADYYGLTKQQLISKTRTSNISNARHIAMYLCRKFIDMPFVKIGEEFGKRDHSTVMNACDKVEKKIKKDILYKQAVTEIEVLLKGI